MSTMNDGPYTPRSLPGARKEPEANGEVQRLMRRVRKLETDLTYLAQYIALVENLGSWINIDDEWVRHAMQDKVTDIAGERQL